MPEQQDETVLTGTEAQAAVEELGWRLLLGWIRLSVRVQGLADASRIAAAMTALPGADGHLRLDMRSERVELALQTGTVAGITAADVELARMVSESVENLGLHSPGRSSSESPRPVQMLEVAIDALDIASIRPFWKAVLAYADESGHHGPKDPLVDPAGQLPAFWFQQMDSARRQRNRIHLDVTVSHDEAEARVAAAIAAGGTLVSSSHARSFWVLADPEGNEACVCTWMDRDGGSPGPTV